LNEHTRLSKILTLKKAIEYINDLTSILSETGGCKPVDASTLPAQPRRRRRRKFPKVSVNDDEAAIVNNTNGIAQKIQSSAVNHNSSESIKTTNASSEIEIKIKKKKIKHEKKEAKNGNL